MIKRIYSGERIAADYILDVCSVRSCCKIWNVVGGARENIGVGFCKFWATGVIFLV